MAVYVTSDIHGEYDMFMEMLERIGLKDDDTLYILGDILDRGPQPLKTLLAVMEMPNVICMLGNHELMAMDCLDFLMQEITEEALTELDAKVLENLLVWMHNGCGTTIKEFHGLDRETRLSVIDFINDLIVYQELTVNGKEYLLVHAGLGGFEPDKDLDDYSLTELVWDRAAYDVQYFDDVCVVSGHTPTQYIRENPKPGYIFRGKNHIAIDCGCYRPDGRLAAVCLDTGEEYYVERNIRQPV